MEKDIGCGRKIREEGGEVTNEREGGQVTQKKNRKTTKTQDKREKRNKRESRLTSRKAR